MHHFIGNMTQSLDNLRK